MELWALGLGLVVVVQAEGEEIFAAMTSRECPCLPIESAVVERDQLG